MERKHPKVKVQLIEDANPRCIVCGSAEMVKSGTHMAGFSSHSIRGPTFVQRYRCKRCGSSQRAGANRKAGPRYRFDSDFVNHAMSLVRSGKSTRVVSEAVERKFGLSVSSATVYKWAKMFLKKDWGRDRTARAKVLNVLKSSTKHQSITTISKLSGVKYNTVKTVLRRFKRPASPKPKVAILVQKRITYLERRISEMQGELKRLRRA